ncbi:MAG: hypothetical protein LUD17_14510 [Bacteroidales bacterium]|nr:hypothetical protein [Bacteroidales bacterium]MCD8388075.1 hypothetical protein [Bacteroidales bacterium]
MNQEYQEKFEQKVHQLIANYLVGKDAIDNMLPEAPDIEDRWEGICNAYLPDGAREFQNYPTVSLGWMMFIGMAVAKMWDEDWEMYSKFEDIYATILLKGKGYDLMDEYICQDILKLTPEEEEKTSTLVADTATLVHKALMREGFEAGTPEAFNAYVRCLHQLYYFGAAVELKRLGYHMTQIS